MVSEFPKPAHFLKCCLLKICWSEGSLWGILWTHLPSMFQDIFVEKPFALILLSLASLGFFLCHRIPPEFHAAGWILLLSCLYLPWFPVPLSTHLLLLCHSRCLRNIWNFTGHKELGYCKKNSKYYTDTLLLSSLRVESIQGKCSWEYLSCFISKGSFYSPVLSQSQKRNEK